MKGQQESVVNIEVAEIRLISKRIRDIAARLELARNTQDMDAVKADLAKCQHQLNHLNQRLRRLDHSAEGLKRSREAASARLKPYLGL
jgi:predicted  nucleic acid-binding Zn-ribbon protein